MPLRLPEAYVMILGGERLVRFSLDEKPATGLRGTPSCLGLGISHFDG